MKGKYKVRCKVFFIMLAFAMVTGMFFKPAKIYATQKSSDEFLQFYENETSQEVQTADQNHPFSLTYGQKRIIYVDHQNETVFYKVVALSDESIATVEEMESKRPGCTAFILTPKGIGELQVTFQKSNHQDVKMHIKIHPRPVKVMVSDAIRSFGHAYNNEIEGNVPDYVFCQQQWLDVEIGNENGNSGMLEKDYRELKSEEALIEEQSDGNEANPGEYQDALSVDFTKLEHCENYSFAITKGALTIKREEISEENVSSYLALDGSGDNPTMYIDADGRLWLKADGGFLKLVPKTVKLYDSVHLVRINEKQVKENLTTNGYRFVESEQYGAVTLTLQLTSERGAESAEFPYVVYLDHAAPEVSISSIKEGEKTPIENFANQISFGAFEKTSYTVEIKVSESEGVGLKEWTYMVLPLCKDIINDAEKPESTFMKYIEGIQAAGEYVWQPMSVSEEATEIQIERKDVEDPRFVANNYVVLVKPYDYVTNSKIYTSLGMVLDNNDPYIDLTFAQGQEEKDVYASDVNLQVSVTDYHNPPDQAVSGLEQVFYQVGIGQENLEKAEKNYLYQAEEGKKYTLDELQKEVITREFTVEGKWNSNDVWVRVTVVDHSGNQYFAYKQLKMDQVCPQITVDYETEATEDYAPYYKEDRIAIIKIKERNIDATKLDGIWFDLQLEGDDHEASYTWSSLKEVKGVTCDFLRDTEESMEAFQYTDERVIELKVCFHGNNEYKFDVHCKDIAGLENQEKNEAYFVIDKIMPEIQVSYWNEAGTLEVSKKEASRVYSSKPVTAKVEITEHNFATKGKDVPVEIHVKATKTGEYEIIPDYKNEVWTSKGDIHTSMYDFSSDGNYTHEIIYTDLAGNTVSYGMDYFTVDKTQPTGTIAVKGFGFWESLLKKLTFGLFSPSSIEIELMGKDDTSPIAPVQFGRFSDQMTREELETYSDWLSASEEKPESAVFTVDSDEKFVVYAKVTDYAGNYQFFSSDGIIMDGTEPTPAVTITNLSQSQKGIFNEDVRLQIDVEEPVINESYAGLEKVWYQISATGNVTVSDTVELLNSSSKRMQGNKKFREIITIPAEIYNSNDVKIQAFARDLAGNEGKSKVTELKIDVTKPKITVVWDLKHPINGKYYRDTRTATVTITDRNFDLEGVKFNITNTEKESAKVGSWTSSKDFGNSDYASSTCQVSFSTDGDYTFTLECRDLAGNFVAYDYVEKFTMDKTAPVVMVSYDNKNGENGSYFNKIRTATVTIHEHNFNETDVHAVITANLDKGVCRIPSISSFTSKGDVHTATISYTEDGDYTFDIDYSDMAGNVAEDYERESFTIDLTAPELKITGVEDKSANNGVVAPKIEVTDINYDIKGISVLISGANNGVLKADQTVENIPNGQVLKFNDFERIEEMDDLYTLQARVRDLAGNEAKREIVFSVNRYGSIFVLDHETKDWLKIGNQGYTYVKEEKAIGIREINVDSIEERSIHVNRDGNLVKLRENKDFTVENLETKGRWKESRYVIGKENFKTEGNYTVILSTKDQARNSMNNTSVKRENENLPIEFAVDKTAPTVVVSGIENQKQYKTARKVMLVDAKDNLALTRVSVTIDGKKTVYEGKELLEKNGRIETSVSGANKWQNIEITAEDAAGNVWEKPIVFRVLITPNIWIQYYMNKPLFYASLASILAVIGFVFLLAHSNK